MAPSTAARRLCLILATLAMIIAGLAARPVAAAPLAQVLEITLLPGTVELDPLLAEAIVAALADQAADRAAYFAATDLQQADGWAMVSFVGLADVGEDQDWHAEDGVWFGLVLAQQTSAGTWRVAIQGTDLYFSMLSELPEGVLGTSAARTLAERSDLRAAGSAMIFPWSAGSAMIYGPLGIHDGGAGWKAVDLASDGNTSAGHASGKIVAAQAGTIDYVCRDGNSVTIRMSGMLYAHLLDNPGLYSGRTLVQGEEIGQLKAGTFNAPCGYASQPANWFHLHWAFPNADLIVEDWTLSMVTGLWTNGSRTASPGRDWITARGMSAPDCSQITGAGIMLFANSNCDTAGALHSLTSAAPRQDLAEDINDAISSVYVAPGWSVKLWEDSRSGGAETWRCFSQTVAGLAGTTYGHGATQSLVEDSASSARVYDRPGCPGAPSDFDDDGRSDAVKYYPDAGSVWWLGSSSGDWRSNNLGTGPYSYVPRSDFDGDSVTDPAKFVPSAGAVWYVESGTGLWRGLYVGGDYTPGASGSDFDGDGRTDPAKYVASSGSLWYLASGTGEWVGTFIGYDAAPYLAGSDYDGDGRSDLAKFVASAGAIWYRSSATGAWQGIFIGFDGTPVAASDFDGDGRTDAAKYLVDSNSLWYRASSSGQWQGRYLGPGSFRYVEAGDFDGDGRTDPAKFIPSTGSVWYLKSTTGTWQGIWLGQGTYDVVN